MKKGKYANECHATSVGYPTADSQKGLNVTLTPKGKPGRNDSLIANADGGKVQEKLADNTGEGKEALPVDMNYSYNSNA